MGKKKTPSQIGKSSKRKGRAFEQKIARELRELLPAFEVKRGWQSRDGDEDPDVVCGDYWFECKDRKVECSKAALEQAELATDGRLPIAVTKLPRKQPVVTMRLRTLADLTGPGGSAVYQAVEGVIVRISWVAFKVVLLEREFARQRAEK